MIANNESARAPSWHAWMEPRIHAFASVSIRCGATRQDVLARAKYQFEESSQDGRIEDVINGNCDELLVEF
jgi:hypothetical protein